MAARKAPKGWVRVSAKQYKNPSGETVSRRQYDNARLRALGFKNRAEAERLRASPTFRDMGTRVARARGGTPKQVKATDSEFTKLALKAFRQDWGKKGGKGAGPKSPMAKILTMAGLRDPDAVNRIAQGYPGRRKRH